jgi:tetratricopeptide (TPR) repeat protein
MKRLFLGAVILAALVGLLYVPTGSFGFLHLDDHDYTFLCPFVHDGLSWGNIKEAFTNLSHGGVWMPLTYISYMCDISLFGPGAGPHHLMNVALHMVNTMLLLALAWRLAGNRQHFWIVIAVAFWAFHPQRVEAVAWIASRKELLWAAFALAGLLFWGSANHRSAIRSIAAYLCCALACMSKPTAMCFPALALCVDLAMRRGSLRSRIFPYLPLLLMAVATGALAMYSQPHPAGHEVRALFSASLPWRLLNAIVAIGLSLFQMVVPVGIHIDYRAVPGQWPIHGLLGCLVFASCLVPGAWCLVRRAWCGPRGQDPSAKATHQAPSTKHQAPTISILWFLAAILPTLGIFGSFGEHARADRFLYVPMMAVVLAVACWPRRELGALSFELRAFSFQLGALSGPCGQDVGAKATLQAPSSKPKAKSSKLKALSSLKPLLVLGGLLALAASAWPVIDSYRNDESVFRRALRFDPDNGRALAHVGQAECAQRNGIDRGIEHLRRSQAVRPRDDTSAQLAYALAMRGHSGDFGEIRRLCSKFACDHTLDRKGQALEALGMTAMRQRRWSEAIGCLYDSIRAPNRFYSNEDAMLKLAACLCNAGRQAEATKWLEQLTRSKRNDIRGKAIQSLETLKRNPRTVLFLD